MPDIRADKSKLEKVSSSINGFQVEIANINKSLAEVDRGLGWDINGKEAIGERIKKIHDELEVHTKSMAELSMFLVTVIDQYDQCDKALETEIETFDGKSGEGSQNKQLVNNIITFLNKPQSAALSTVLTLIAPEIGGPFSLARLIAMKDEEKVYKELYNNSYENGLFKGNVNVLAGKYSVESNCDAELVNGEIPIVELSKEIQASGVEANIDGRYGDKDAAIFGEATGSLFKGDMKGKLEADLKEGSLGAGVEGKVSVFQGEAKGGVEVLGYKIGMEVEGDALSAGGEAKIDMDLLDKDKDGKIFEAGLGGSLGVGGSVGLVVEKA